MSIVLYIFYRKLLIYIEKSRITQHITCPSESPDKSYVPGFIYGNITILVTVGPDVTSGLA
ncbi:MAG: hypothetical protein V1709_01120, partial [Planctomycetota bacterium]